MRRRISETLIARRTAPVSSDFGRGYAVHLFGQAILDSLPVYSSGARKGLPKGTLKWTECVPGAGRTPEFVYATLYLGNKWVTDTTYPSHAEHEAAEALAGMSLTGL